MGRQCYSKMLIEVISGRWDIKKKFLKSIKLALFQYPAPYVADRKELSGNAYKIYWIFLAFLNKTYYLCDGKTRYLNVHMDMFTISFLVFFLSNLI